MEPTFFWALIAGLYGLLFGSFANVVIWRMPRGESLVTPGSHCPDCSTPIPWYDNIPVASWLLLRGRCRNCGKAISIRYPMVELASGALWALAVLAFGPSARAGFAIVFYYVLLLLSAVDLQTFRLPNLLLGILAAVGAAGVATSSLTRTPALPLIDAGLQPWWAAIIGAVASAGTALAIALLYKLMRNAEGFGMGDVKLLAVIGLYLGPHGLMTLFLASIVGAVYGVIVSRRHADGLKARIPFGPFLAGSAVMISLIGPQAWSAYMNLVTG